MPRRWTTVLILAAGCSNAEKDPDFQIDMQLANEYYKHGKFEEAIRKYEDAIEKIPSSYRAVVGLACADRGWGLRKFGEAEEMFRIKKVDIAKREFEKAVAVHATAQRLYLKAIEMNHEDPLAYRELGYFYYRRATSPYSYPYRLDDEVNRTRDRDLAIQHFRVVVAREPKTYFAQRYLGLALFASGNSSQGRLHLQEYLKGMGAAREYIVKSAPHQSAEQREDVERRLREIDKEIGEVRDFMLAYVNDLEEKKAKAQQAGETKYVDALNVEILAVHNLVRKYKEVEAEKPQQPQ